jgi:hypothetical protein
LSSGKISASNERRGGTLLDCSGPRLEIPLTSDPDLHLLVNGRGLDAMEQSGSACVSRVPTTARSGSVRIASRQPRLRNWVAPSIRVFWAWREDRNG